MVRDGVGESSNMKFAYVADALRVGTAQTVVAIINADALGWFMSARGVLAPLYKAAVAAFHVRSKGQVI